MQDNFEFTILKQELLNIEKLSRLWIVASLYVFNIKHGYEIAKLSMSIGLGGR
jgi:CRISPR/Cas system endoribonuclease Cas6 (RAMP superfamily)